MMQNKDSVSTFNSQDFQYMLKPTARRDVIQELQKIKQHLGKKQVQKVLGMYFISFQNTKILPRYLYRLFLKQVDEWKLTKYQTYPFKDKRPWILSRISHINFTQLKQLKLSRNTINKIQSLNWLNAPHLDLLDLSKNKIASLKPLVKLNCYELHKIDICCNNFTHGQIHHLSRMKNISTIMKICQLQGKYHLIDISQPLIKLESSQISNKIMWSQMIKDKVIVSFSKRFKFNQVLSNKRYKVDQEDSDDSEWCLKTILKVQDCFIQISFKGLFSLVHQFCLVMFVSPPPSVMPQYQYILYSYTPISLYQYFN